MLRTVTCCCCCFRYKQSLTLLSQVEQRMQQLNEHVQRNLPVPHFRSPSLCFCYPVHGTSRACKVTASSSQYVHANVRPWQPRGGDRLHREVQPRGWRYFNAFCCSLDDHDVGHGTPQPFLCPATETTTSSFTSARRTSSSSTAWREKDAPLPLESRYRQCTC